MSPALTIAGATLEAIGLGLVFAELAVIRSREFGVPTPLARLTGWVRRRLGRGEVIEVSGTMSARSSLKGRLTVRPEEAATDATDADRLARLERYVERIDEDLAGLVEELGRQSAEVIAEARRGDEELRREMTAREAQRRSSLRSSL